ncbi:GAF domain-containing sensor histidine kinase [Dactylosporangium sp. CA-092794]|uniref:GAF domain-containing sensor histidine kinase n=1 Tax=Dactylosporangium sp. CA-092794 TaxID=3239929 RepID=UPI003D8B00F1
MRRRSTARLAAWLVRPTPPPVALGIAVGALLVTAEMLVIHLLEQTASRHALVVVFFVGVLAISTIWGIRLALAMVVVSAAAYNIVWVPRVRNLDVSRPREWIELAAFLVAAVLASLMASLARVRAVESLERRQEAELLVALSRHMLATDNLRAVLPGAARRIASTLRLPFAEILLDRAPDGDLRGEHRRDTRPQTAFPLRFGERTGTLLVPDGLRPHTLSRLRDRLLPRLDILFTVAAERQAMGDELRRLAAEQAGVRRVAVLVARGAPPEEVVAAVAAESAALLDADATRLARLESAGTVVVMAEYNRSGEGDLVGRRFALEGGVTQLVVREARAARIDSFDRRSGDLADLARSEGVTASIAAPITVEGRMWGSLVVLWRERPPPPAGAEARLAQFTELVATAVANAESRRELKASRARIVMAADEARRRLERDLHDGVQQRLVSLGLEIRAAEGLVPGGLDELEGRLRRTADGLASTFTEVQQISRGLHPAILSQGGLMPALRTLARRSQVPVSISPGPERRMPGPVEVAAYCVVSEAIANAAKHAHASAIDVAIDVIADPGRRCDVLTLGIRDDGVGGADPALGTGLVGLTDRVEALGGSLRIASPAGQGTSLFVTLPTTIEA